ncbi:MAG TPA: Holliday junction resolvase RuvX [Moorella mulderi]|nr:Holliday junction resolvase RuvX [Moorella mulderi]
MPERRILGLDVGKNTIGVAISDPLGWRAQALTVIKRQNWEKDVEEIKKIVKAYNVTQIVVGLPRRTDGSYGEEAKEILEWGEKLSSSLNLPVVFFDERYTTKVAERVLLEADLSRARRRRTVDKVAAAVILQGYLDRSRRDGVC